MNIQTAEGKRYLIHTAIIEQMSARGAYLNIEHCRDLMSREGQERYRSQWLDCIASLQRTANQAAYAARRNMEAVDLYYGHGVMNDNKSYFVIFRQGVRVGQTWAKDAIEAVDLWIDTAEEKDERRLLPGPYMAVQEAEAKQRGMI